MIRPEPKRLTTPTLLDRLREILMELETESRAGLDLLFGVAPERGGNWLVYEREVDTETAGSRSACCGTAPQVAPRDAAAEFLRAAIEMIEREPLFARANLQFRPDTPKTYLGFVEFKIAMDWRIWGAPLVHHTVHRHPEKDGDP